jgi:hypothetical protein
LKWHNAKSLAFDNEGGMYVTFSGSTNVCENWNSNNYYNDNSTAGVQGYYPCPELKDLAGIWKFDENKLITICVYNSACIVENYCQLVLQHNGSNAISLRD